MNSNAPQTRKISETLIDFAKPILSLIEDNMTDEQVQQLLSVAVTVWNTEVLDEASGTTKYKDMMEAHLGDKLSSMPFIQELIDRKQTHFKADMRTISDISVYRKNGQLMIKAEARIPAEPGQN